MPYWAKIKNHLSKFWKQQANARQPPLVHVKLEKFKSFDSYQLYMASHIFSIWCGCIMYLSIWLIPENDEGFWLDSWLFTFKYLRKVHNFLLKGNWFFSGLANIVCLHMFAIAPKNRLLVAYYCFSAIPVEGWLWGLSIGDHMHKKIFLKN